MSRLTQARQATREQLKARVALDGPSGSGKTWTSLEWAAVLAGSDGKPLHIDTEHGSASLYADRFDFDTLRWDPPYDLDELADTIRDAGSQYPVIVVDSWSHFWEGEGGTLDTADAAGQRSGGNSFAGWKVATPKLRHLIDTILASPAHVIVTMRTKTEWVVEPDPRTGKMVPRRVGTAPVMRQGIEYEFTLVGDLDLEHRLVITKSRCAPLADAVVQPGRASDAASTFASWLTAGEAMPTPAEVQDLKDRLNAQPGAVRRTFKERWGHPDRVTAVQLPDVLAWLDSLDDDPDPDGPKTSAPAEGEQTTKEASGAHDSVADLGDRSPAPDEGALGPEAGEGDEASTATHAEDPAPVEGDVEEGTRRRLFALVGECCPTVKNLSAAANEEVRKQWLLLLVQALDGTAVPLESRSEISERSARKAILACEEIAEGRATYEDFVEGRVRVNVRANGGMAVQRKRGKAAA